MTTVLDALRDSVRARLVHRDGEAPPAAILWTDPKREWLPAVQQLQNALPELLVLDDYEPDRRAGPAVWLRGIVDGTIEGVVPDGATPILLLPDVGRQDLQAGQETDELLQPLTELMYRGTMWLQHNGSDWTARNFLGSKLTLELDLAKDQKSEAALKRCLPELLGQRVEDLQGRHLDAAAFDKLLSPDPDRDLLLWMDDPKGKSDAMGDEQWEALCLQCKNTLGFDPSSEDPIVAGEHLGRGEGSWGKVWSRFEEAPDTYPGVVEVLLRATPAGNTFGSLDGERWPKRNDDLEAELRHALEGLREATGADAAPVVLDLEKQHGKRRKWLWADLGRSPLTRPLEHLAKLAERCSQPLNGARLDDFATNYVEDGWLADAASWEAAHAAEVDDVELVHQVIRVLLGDWLDVSAKNLQRVVAQEPLPDHRSFAPVKKEPDQCIVFIDGLRYDVGRRLGERLELRDCRVEVRHRWAALPTVTATGKLAVSPVTEQIQGDGLPPSFSPSVAESGREIQKPELLAMLKKAGVTVLDRDAPMFPESEPAYGWAECGDIDGLGHKVEAKLARSLDEELAKAAKHIVSLLDRGWKSVRVVTDHGWLWLPGGLPKAALPKHLTESQWARCAALAEGSNPDGIPMLPWFWNGLHAVASPAGVACFRNGVEYTHGGLSMQEALIPDLVVERMGGVRRQVGVGAITWRGYRCMVEVPGGDGLVAELRRDSSSGDAVAKSKVVDEGAVSLLLQDDEHAGAELFVVLLAEDGTILAQRPTRVE